MEISITKMSSNGQVVIPSEIRENGMIKPLTKFLVFNKQGNIFLKQIKEDSLIKDMEFVERIRESEEQIKNGEFVSVNANLEENEIDKILMN